MTWMPLGGEMERWRKRREQIFGFRGTVHSYFASSSLSVRTQTVLCLSQREQKHNSHNLH